MWHRHFKTMLLRAVALIWAITLSLTEHPLNTFANTSLSRSPVFLAHPWRVGIDYPLLIKIPLSMNLSSLYHHITLAPHESFILTRLTDHEFALRPRGFWPGSTLIRCTLSTPRGVVETVFDTDDGKILRVSLSTQSMEAYEGGTLVRVMPVSTGTAPNWTTPQGTFYIYRRVLDDHMRGGTPGTQDTWDVSHVPYAQYIYKAVAIHGAWWNHHFGIPRSHGCIQLSTKIHNSHPATVVDNAKWVWNFTDIGTPVIISGQTPPDPARVLPYPEE
ncbi:MAG: hypothetical protein C7B43_03185 [Sulfobacillus benefaciens]|uniref:L,D-TPase catalytic domain-containing protein n=1 Tax=Sulfobacillus benefaciens TaxID=453960 RepID=A0A2T2X9I8_9FIRM|nr:MAG: hypothetical protein C7B43_03185 [Sulfobacillus benefaciens]